MVYNTGNADTTGTADGSKIRGGMVSSRYYLLNLLVSISFFVFSFVKHTCTHQIFSLLQQQQQQRKQKGFGRIGITVPNVYKACERFQKLGVAFHKSPNSGGMKGLAFIKDPDGYLIEVLPQGEMIVEDVDCCGVAAEGGEGYKDNSK